MRATEDEQDELHAMGYDAAMSDAIAIVVEGLVNTNGASLRDRAERMESVAAWARREAKRLHDDADYHEQGQVSA